MTIVTQATRLVGKEKCVWLFWQPKITARLGLSFEGPIPEGAFQMYHHDLRLWTALPEPTRPILVLPGRALLWRCTGISKMPEIESWITLTSHNATPIPDIPNLPSKIEPFFSRKSLDAGMGVKNAIGLITSPNKTTKPRTPRKRTRRATSLFITPRSTAPPETPGKRARTGSASPASSRARTSPEPETLSSLLLQLLSSSPPAPSQLLRDVFGETWKTSRPRNATPGPSTNKRPASPGEQGATAKRVKYETIAEAPTIAKPHKQMRRHFIPPPDVIEISSDEDDLVVIAPKKNKGKGKAKERKPIPADAEIIELSD